MPKWKKATRIQELKKGDHISERLHDIFSHHRIVVWVDYERGSFISVEYTYDKGSDKRMIKEVHEEFRVDVFYVAEYDCEFSPDEIVERAYKKIGEKKYDLVFNNCEHFAYWCRTGDNKSIQVRVGVAVAAGTVAVVGGLLAGLFIGKSKENRQRDQVSI